MQTHSEIGERILAKVDDYDGSPRSSAITTNASTATDTQMDSLKMKSR